MSGLSRFIPVLILAVSPVVFGAQPAPAPQAGGHRQPAPRPGGPPADAPKDAVFFKVQTLQAVEEKVDLLRDLGKNDAIIEELKKVYAVDLPKDSPAYEMKSHLIGRLAMAYADAGRKPEAIDTLKKLLADVLPGTPAEASAWLEAGSVYKKLKMSEEALKAFDRAIELSKKLAQSGWRPPRPPGPPGGRAPGGAPRGPGGGPQGSGGRPPGAPRP